MNTIRNERRSGLDRREDPHENERDRYNDLLDQQAALVAETLMKGHVVEDLARGIELETLRDIAISLRIIAARAPED
ncbi:MAG: hypothetical protein V3T08_09415 [Gemmatimonadota bacterium]